MQKNLKIILASKSPRRKELLSILNIPFEIFAVDTKETLLDVSPKQNAINIADIKASTSMKKYFKLNTCHDYIKYIFIGADTIVVNGSSIFGKPKDRKDAFEMISQLSNKKHSVITAISFKSRYKSSIKSFNFTVSTEVYFEKLSNDDIDFYLNNEEYADKAGSYAIQGIAQSFISKINGSYSNVVGFPLSDVKKELYRFI